MQTCDPQGDHEKRTGAELEGGDKPRGRKDVEETLIEYVEDDVEGVPTSDIESEADGAVGVVAVLLWCWGGR